MLNVDVWVMNEGIFDKLFKVPESSFIGPIGHVVLVAFSKSGDKVLLEVDKKWIRRISFGMILEGGKPGKICYVFVIIFNV